MRWKPNVTVAAVISQDGRYLLVEEQTSDGLRLNNPAGHLDPGESPQQGAVREALEETGCEFTPAGLLGVYLSRHESTTYLRIAYHGSVGAPLPGRTLDDGIVRTLWLTLDEIRASRERHRSPLLLRCVEDHAAGRHLPLDTVYTDASVFVS